MGESVFEATIIGWTKAIGDAIEADETVLEIATDKVDSDVPSPVAGVLKEVLFQEGDTVEVGKVMAIIETDQEVEQSIEVEVEEESEESDEPAVEAEPEAIAPHVEAEIEAEMEEVLESVKPAKPAKPKTSEGAYYSPLVMNIAQAEQIPLSELEAIQGSGKGGRVTKEDILAYVANRKKAPAQKATAPSSKSKEAKREAPAFSSAEKSSTPVFNGPGDEIVEMDRMRKLIARHMIDSKKTSAHVSSFVEADMTNVVNWRNKHKEAFLKREGFKLSFMPIILEAMVHAIREYPMINASVDGDRIIVKRDINLGVATALPSGNLIVPVIKNADQRNLVGIAREMNAIVNRARTGKLKPDDTQGGTYTISNVGTFGNVFGTPIINQPQVAIMAVGSIVKKPAVLETAQGDVIAIRHKMYLSHTYDHRVVDGMLGGLFVKRVGELLEQWDVNREL